MPKVQTVNPTLDGGCESYASYNKKLAERYKQLEESGLLDDDFDEILYSLVDISEIKEYLEIVKYFTNRMRLYKFEEEEQELFLERKEQLEELLKELDFSSVVDDILN